MAGNGRKLSCAEVLALIPQQRPFRFVDELLQIDESRSVGRYRFRPDEFFYAGHFPGHPLTPGVILMETMAQIGVVALGIYLLVADVDPTDPGQTNRRPSFLFCDGEIELFLPVPCGAEVTVEAEKVFWRRTKIRARANLRLANGEIAASSTLSGIHHEQS